MFWLLVLVLIASVALGLVHETSPYVGLLGIPDVVTFTATPDVVAPGQPVMLSWKTRGTGTIAIDFGPVEEPRGSFEHHGNLPPVGTLQVKPTKDSIFVVGCQSVASLDCQPKVISVRVKGSTTQVPVE